MSKVVGGKVGKREWRYLHSLLHQLGLLQMFLVVFITRVFVALSLWSPKSVPKNNHKEMSQKVLKSDNKRVTKIVPKKCPKKFPKNSVSKKCEVKGVPKNRSG